jgi:hypothetical protein
VQAGKRASLNKFFLMDSQTIFEAFFFAVAAVSLLILSLALSFQTVLARIGAEQKHQRPLPLIYSLKTLFVDL